MGEIKFSIIGENRGLEIEIRGFSDKIPLFISKVAKKIVKLKTTVDM